MLAVDQGCGLELQAQVVVDDRDQPNLSSFALYGQVAAVVVAELQAGKLSLAESKAKKEQDGYAVTLPRTGS